MNSPQTEEMFIFQSEKGYSAIPGRIFGHNKLVLNICGDEYSQFCHGRESAPNFLQLQLGF